MTRPYVQSKAKNEIKRLREHLETQLPHLKDLPGVVGLVLNGGMSRGYGDHLSDIDVVIYLSSEIFDTWKTSGTPISVGIVVLDGQIYDIKYCDIDRERARDWTALDLWDTSYAEIIYDPTGVVQALFDEKLLVRPDPNEKQGFLFEVWGRFYLACNTWILRGDSLQGHHTLNDAVAPLVKAVFLANEEYIPYEKWLIHMSRSLTWTPDNWEQRLAMAMHTGDMSIESVKARQTVIETLWNEVDAHIIERFYPDLPVRMMQKSYYERLKLLVEESPMSIQTWQDRKGGSLPEGDAFFQALRVEGNMIFVDIESFLKIKPEDMYVWHYEVAEAVAKTLRR
jgi:predicted nucleotidyltransferase